MNITTSPARWKTIAFFVILAAVLAGCAGTRQGVAWPALQTITINDETKILVSYENRVEILEPGNGNITRLVDAEGEFIEDEQGNRLGWILEGEPVEGLQFFANPSYIAEDDTLIFPTYNNTLIEVQVDTARLANPGVGIAGIALASMAVSDEYFYIPFRQQNLAAINRESFEQEWLVETEGGVWTQPLLVDDVLYIPSIDHKLYAVDAATGEPVWAEPVDLEGAIASTPLLLDNYLYVGSYSHKLYKVDLDGTIVAEHEGNNWIWGTPVEYDGVLYYADLSGYVYAVNADDLSEVWRTQATTSGSRRGIRPAPVVSEEFVVVAARNGILYWLDRESGDIVIEREYEGAPELLTDVLLIEADAAAGISDSIVVAGSADAGRLIAAFSLENGLPIWVYGR